MVGSYSEILAAINIRGLRMLAIAQDWR